MSTRIFLDSGDPAETRRVLAADITLDGQTTNPSLIAKSPIIAERKKRGALFGKEELLDFYRTIVKEISALLPDGSVSVEVYADRNTAAEDMLTQARECNAWIPNAHIKLPVTEQGLIAAQLALSENLRVNLTLAFTQEQAAAVYAATSGAKKGDVFLSPFIGRLDDIGLNGIDLIRAIHALYATGDGHVEVLAASIRSKRHYRESINLGADIITAPAKILLALDNAPPADVDTAPLKPIPHATLNLKEDWRTFDITHELTDKGLDRFVADWNALLSS